RFIINIPEEERQRQDLVRIFFQIELAHWFYLDFYCTETNLQLKPCGIKEFATKIFKHCPFLQEHADNVEEILANWKEYKMAVPTYGAIMVDPTLQFCLLVQGYWAKASWGFPKGKVNEEEAEHDCAIREVLEETGYDISGLIDKHEHIELKINEQVTRLYIVPGVPMDTAFMPKTRKEIKNLEWFEIEHLPKHKKDEVSKEKLGLNPNSFFMVMPFVKHLRKWRSRKLNQRDTHEHSVSPYQQHKHQQTKHSKLLTSGTKPLSTNERQKQQEQFALQNQQEFQDYVGLGPGMKLTSALANDKKQHNGKTTKDKDPRAQSSSPPPRFKKGRPNAQSTPTKPHTKNASQIQPHKQFLILNRDGTYTEVSNDAKPQPNITDSSEEERNYTKTSRPRRSKKDHEFSSKTWTNFKLDVQSIMNLFP
ncbi:unnamed protein product, partial [Owenia fusiformis]